ncbi:hypothetical protein HMPREF0294_1656 [Corynebacterium glucuronolyticum ATCC 51867]|nr:hypothetical protein HMPREF0294_1656 [Corynebacterium glucuronolyticum ATCC 51867]
MREYLHRQQKGAFKPSIDHDPTITQNTKERDPPKAPCYPKATGGS